MTDDDTETITTNEISGLRRNRLPLQVSTWSVPRKIITTQFNK